MAAAHVPPRVARIVAERGMGDLTCFFEPVGGRPLDKATEIYVFEDGCVLGNAKNDTYDHFRWDDVERFTQWAGHKPVRKSTTLTYGFGLLDGRTLKVDGMATGPNRSGLEGFGELVDPMVTAAQLPAMAARLERGEPVTFGLRLRVEPGGLRQSAVLRKRLSWADLKEVTVEQGAVVVRSHGRRRAWGSVSAGTVPNLRAFMTLVRSASARSRPGA